MTVHFNPKHFYELMREDGHLYVTLQTIYENCPEGGADIDFVVDTGAYLTVLNRTTAIITRP